MSFISKSIPDLSNPFNEALAGISSVFGVAGSILYGTGDLDNLPASDIQKSNIINNISLITYGMSRYYFNTRKIKPGAMLAGIPLPSIQELSHAMSNRELKYRATGGVFLAHQEGGDQSLRIVGQAFGANRYIFLTMLDFLFLYGGARQVDLFKDKLENLSEIEEIENLNDRKTKDQWEEFYEAAIDAGNTEAHLTFPVITRNRVYTNMYIETYEYTESVENGMNVVEYSIFLRKYRPDREMKLVEVTPEDEDSDEDSSYFYRPKEEQSSKNRYDLLDTFMDFSYSGLLLLYRMIQRRGWGSLVASFARLLGIRISSQREQTQAGGLTISEKEELYSF